ncbi:hypothetical protein Cantr_00400 [Candida viswanathii]|uniref:Protein HRI1 n=1 Tax=Candida viswanathii TaxID=5486 RepID=A0A367YFM7_9ASCO|nr:hypothetical protein Cantr_00400 [Candida viswanathii]
MVVSTRVSIQWPPEQPQELTSTLALTTPGNNYVDIRVFKTKYPYTTTTTTSTNENFTEVFELALAGTEVPLDQGRIKFDNSISSMALEESIATGNPIVIDSDIGMFSAHGEDRKETGEMKNGKGVVAPYIEIWRSLDPLKHTPSQEVREGEEGEVPAFALELVGGLGKLVRVGNWIQGIVQEERTIHVVRSWFDEEKGGWKNLIEFGKLDIFPIEFSGALDDVVSRSDGWQWKCIEKNY